MELNKLISTREHLLNAIRAIEEDMHTFSWEKIADSGAKFVAITAHRKKNNCSLAESKKRVEEYLKPAIS